MHYLEKRSLRAGNLRLSAQVFSLRPPIAILKVGEKVKKLLVVHLNYPDQRFYNNTPQPSRFFFAISQNIFNVAAQISALRSEFRFYMQPSPAKEPRDTLTLHGRGQVEGKRRSCCRLMCHLEQLIRGSGFDL